MMIKLIIQFGEVCEAIQIMGIYQPLYLGHYCSGDMCKTFHQLDVISGMDYPLAPSGNPTHGKWP